MSLPPSQLDDDDRERQVLVRAIRRLPRHYRDVFILHRFTEMPVEQIADVTGKSKEGGQRSQFDDEVRFCEPFYIN